MSCGINNKIKFQRVHVNIASKIQYCVDKYDLKMTIH